MGHPEHGKERLWGALDLDNILAPVESVPLIEMDDACANVGSSRAPNGPAVGGDPNPQVRYTAHNPTKMLLHTQIPTRSRL